MQNEPDWLASHDLIEINEAIVGETGEPHALLSEPLLDSASASPINRYHYAEERDVIVLGVRLLFSVARNHPFEQGNKRTGFIAFIEFLGINGYDFLHPDHEELGKRVVDVLNGISTEEEFAELVGPFVHPTPAEEEVAE